MRLTKEQAAIIGAYTGVACGPFSDVHQKIEQALKRPVLTHELGTPDIWQEIRTAVRPEFMAICYEERK